MRKRKTDSFYSFWSAAIFLALLLVLFSIIFVSCVGGDEAPSGQNPPASASPPVSVSPPASQEPSGETAPPEDTAEPTSDVTEPPTPFILTETEDMGQEYIDKFVFMGDSTTYGLAAYNVVPKTQVWTPASGTFSLFNQSIITIVYPETGEELTIEQLLEQKKPEYLLITLGVNGVLQMEEQYFVSEYVKLIERIQQGSPNTKIIVNSMYPVCAYYTSIDNAKITEGNTWLIQVVEQTGTRFIDCASVLRGEDGYMMDELSNGDGIHLNQDGLARVISYIRTHGYR